MNQSGRPPWPARERRYDWFRLYNDFPGHPKFRYVAGQTGASITDVQAIASSLLVAANKSKPRGWVADFDPFECAALHNLEPEIVVAVFKEFEQLGWIEQDYLSTWDKRQPDREDPTATERKQRQRAKLKAARGGQAAAAAPAAPPPASPEQEAAAAKLAAQYWCFSEGLQIVAGRTGEKTLAVELRMKRWGNEIGKDYEALQEIIRGAAAANLNGDAFRNQVAGRVDVARRLMTVGPPLPMDRPGIIKGGAA